VLVSIIIPAYNAEKTLARCLEACLNQTYSDVEVIVVDDGSTDSTPQIAESFSATFLTQQRQGPAAARNRGAETAKGEYLAFTDSDCVPAPDWIERLVSEMGDGVAAVGGTYDIANPESLLARMVHEEIVARHARLDRDVDFLGSFNLMVRRAAFEEVGGFDESFPRASGEDNDLAYRLQNAGGRLRFVPEAAVAHYHPTRLWPYLRAQARHGYWRMKLYTKHPNRAKQGDRYASVIDLAGPPLSIMAVAALMLAVVLVAAGVGGRAVTGISALPVAYAALQVRMPARMATRTRDGRMALFTGVVILRDVARAAGMVAGMVQFLWRQKGA